MKLVWDLLDQQPKYIVAVTVNVSAAKVSLCSSQVAIKKKLTYKLSFPAEFEVMDCAVPGIFARRVYCLFRTLHPVSVLFGAYGR